MCLGIWAHWLYRHDLDADASFGQNDRYPAAVLLQHFNIGYFLCDIIHVTVWEPRFFLHHSIALAGYGTSELANVFALANAVNTWVTEVGSLMYSSYLLVKTDAATLCLLCSTPSRASTLSFGAALFSGKYGASCKL